MAGKLEGKVAFITGAARGQGRSHAIRPAQEVVNDIMQEWLANDPIIGQAMANALPVDMVEAMVSDDARYVTGVTLPVDAGFTNKK